MLDAGSPPETERESGPLGSGRVWGPGPGSSAGGVGIPIASAVHHTLEVVLITGPRPFALFVPRKGPRTHWAKYV
eukprot:1554177-Rhodomonas_salina.1